MVRSSLRVRIAKKEIGLAVGLALTIAILSLLYNVSLERESPGRVLVAQRARTSSGLAFSSSPLGIGSSDRVRIMDADIHGELEAGTFEVVVPFIEALTREKGGLIETEFMAFKDGLWSGRIVSKLPPTNASSFTIEARRMIDENGRVVTIDIDIQEFTLNQSTTGVEQYSTIKTFLNEEFEGEEETPQPVIQLMSVFPILVTGLVWVAEALIVGVPLCFVSLGVVMLTKRVIIPLWRKELNRSM